MKNGSSFTGDDSNDGIFVSASPEGISRIRIKSAITEDSGVYTCTASNDAGSTSDMIQVEVNGKCCMKRI